MGELPSNIRKDGNEILFPVVALECGVKASTHSFCEAVPEQAASPSASGISGFLGELIGLIRHVAQGSQTRPQHD